MRYQSKTGSWLQGDWGGASMWIPNDEGGLSEYDMINKHVLPHHVWRHLTRWTLLASEESDVRSIVLVSTGDMREILWRMTIRKAAEPENLPGCALKTSTKQLTDVTTVISNMSLSKPFPPTSRQPPSWLHPECLQCIVWKMTKITFQLVQMLTSLLFKLHTQTGCCCPPLHLHTLWQ